MPLDGSNDLREASLIVRRDGLPDQSFDIRDAETLIGRTPRSDLQVADEAVSREHAVILWEEGVFTVEDLQSTNGIRVNGKRTRSAELHHGDEIESGQTRILMIFR